MIASDFITFNFLRKYYEEGRAVHVYPKKHIACVDGGKYYKVNACTVLLWKDFKKKEA